MNAGTSDMNVGVELQAAPPLVIRREVIHQDVWVGGSVKQVRFEAPVVSLNPDNLWVTHIKPRLDADLTGYTRELRDSHQMWQVETAAKLEKAAQAHLLDMLVKLVDAHPEKVAELLQAALAARELKKQEGA